MQYVHGLSTTLRREGLYLTPDSQVELRFFVKCNCPACKGNYHIKDELLEELPDGIQKLIEWEILENERPFTNTTVDLIAHFISTTGKCKSSERIVDFGVTANDKDNKNFVPIFNIYNIRTQNNPFFCTTLTLFDDIPPFRHKNVPVGGPLYVTSGANYELKEDFEDYLELMPHYLRDFYCMCVGHAREVCFPGTYYDLEENIIFHCNKRIQMMTCKERGILNSIIYGPDDINKAYGLLSAYWNEEGHCVTHFFRALWFHAMWNGLMRLIFPLVHLAAKHPQTLLNCSELYKRCRTQLTNRPLLFQITNSLYHMEMSSIISEAYSIECANVKRSTWIKTNIIPVVPPIYPRPVFVFEGIKNSYEMFEAEAKQREGDKAAGKNVPRRPKKQKKIDPSPRPIEFYYDTGFESPPK